MQPMPGLIRLISIASAFYAVSFFGCRNQPGNTNIPAKSTFSTDYKAASWTEKDRTEKIKSALPLTDSLIMHYMQQEHLPGLACGILLDGKLIHTNYYGYTDLKAKISVDSLSAFRIASMTKSITAMAILILRDQGKLRFDDPASNYIPEMVQMKYISGDAPVITIRDLLTHRAGFPEDNPYGDRQLADSDYDLMNMILQGPSFSNAPGISYEYSNMGFALLGRIISNVSGQPYQQFISEHIFQPLGMTHSRWDYTKVEGRHLAHGYRWINGDWREEALLKDGSWGAMGGLITTIEDFSKYMIFHLSAWPVRNDIDNGPLKRSSVREMQQPWNFSSLNTSYTFPTGRICAIMNSYGYGLRIIKDCNNRTFAGHAGGLPGFGSHWAIMPEYGIGIVIFSNCTYAPISALNIPLLDTILALSKIQPYELPSSSILEQRKNELIKFLPDWNNAESSAIFAENFFPDYPLDSLRKNATELFIKAGKIKTISAVYPSNQLRGYFDMKGEKALIRISFTLSPEHDPKIQEYKIKEVTEKNQ
jgi:CubicO group peptidase (beta-lactamase class C family)